MVRRKVGNLSRDRYTSEPVYKNILDVIVYRTIIKKGLPGSFIYPKTGVSDWGRVSRKNGPSIKSGMSGGKRDLTKRKIGGNTES